MSLTDKYTPTCFKDIVGNKKVYGDILKDLEKSKFKGKYLLNGKPGTGKTTFVNILSKLKKWKISEVKMSEIQTRGSDEKGKEKNGKLKVLFKRSIRKKIILIDDVDLATNVTGIRNKIESKLKVLCQYINKDKNNLIFIVTTENKKAIFKHYDGLKTFTLKKVMDKTITKFVEKILKKEDKELSGKTGGTVIKKLLKNSEGNIRKVLMDLDMMTQGKSKVKFNEGNKNLLEKNTKDKKYNNIYDIMSDSFKTCDMNDSASLQDKENVYWADTFMVGAAAFEYYLKGENCKDINVSSDLSWSFGDADVMNGLRRDCDFTINKFIAYSEYMKPTQQMGKAKTQIFFPSHVSKTSKVKNNHKKMAALKANNPECSHYTYEEYMTLYQLEKINKVTRKEQTVSHTLLKPLFTIM